MEELLRSAHFAPKHTYNGYNISIEMFQIEGGKYRVYMRPAPGKGVLNEDDLSLIIGLDSPKPLPIWIDDEEINIERVMVPEGEAHFLEMEVRLPENEIRLVRDEQKLSFEETFAFFKKYMALVDEQ